MQYRFVVHFWTHSEVFERQWSTANIFTIRQKNELKEDKNVLRDSSHLKSGSNHQNIHDDPFDNPFLLKTASFCVINRKQLGKKTQGV